MGQNDIRTGQPMQNRQETHRHGTQSGDKVFVACKLPNGIIIRGMKKSTEREPVMGGGTREFEIYRPDGRQHTIKGPAVRFGEAPPFLVGGYAFTDFVDKDLYDNWFEANKDQDIITDEIVHAESTKEGIRDWAAKRATVMSGFEGIDPANPGKVIRGIYQGSRSL
jgi:hypothetical protein